MVWLPEAYEGCSSTCQTVWQSKYNLINILTGKNKTFSQQFFYSWYWNNFCSGHTKAWFQEWNEDWSRWFNGAKVCNAYHTRTCTCFVESFVYKLIWYKFYLFQTYLCGDCFKSGWPLVESSLWWLGKWVWSVGRLWITRYVPSGLVWGYGLRSGRTEGQRSEERVLLNER